MGLNRLSYRTFLCLYRGFDEIITRNTGTLWLHIHRSLEVIHNCRGNLNQNQIAAMDCMFCGMCCRAFPVFLRTLGFCRVQKLVFFAVFHLLFIVLTHNLCLCPHRFLMPCHLHHHATAANYPPRSLLSMLNCTSQGGQTFDSLITDVTSCSYA